MLWGPETPGFGHNAVHGDIPRLAGQGGHHLEGIGEGHNEHACSTGTAQKAVIIPASVAQADS